MLTKQQTEFLNMYKDATGKKIDFKIFNEIIDQHGYKESNDNEIPTIDTLFINIEKSFDFDSLEHNTKNGLALLEKLKVSVYALQTLCENQQEQIDQLESQRDNLQAVVTSQNNSLEDYKNEFIKLKMQVRDAEYKIEHVHEPYKTVLTKLVNLKIYKEEHGPQGVTTQYTAQKELLWNIAKSLCNG